MLNIILPTAVGDYENNQKRTNLTKIEMWMSGRAKTKSLVLLRLRSSCFSLSYFSFKIPKQKIYERRERFTYN